MDSIEGLLKFLSAYPAWAKLLVLGNMACIAGVLLFARAPVPDAEAQQPGAYALRIKAVDLFPPSDQAQVQVSAFVNGTEFRYPSLADVEWLRVGPAMAGQVFKLPRAERYELRFEMRKKSGGNIVHLVSQETVSLAKPTAGSYALYGFDPESKTRDATVRAQVSYAFEPAP